MAAEEVGQKRKLKKEEFEDLKRKYYCEEEIYCVEKSKIELDELLQDLNEINPQLENRSFHLPYDVLRPFRFKIQIKVANCTFKRKGKPITKEIQTRFHTKVESLIQEPQQKPHWKLLKEFTDIEDAMSFVWKHANVEEKPLKGRKNIILNLSTPSKDAKGKWEHLVNMIPLRTYVKVKIVDIVIDSDEESEITTTQSETTTNE